MGRYVNQTSKGPLGSSFTEKCKGLIEDGAIRISPTGFQENLVCVVDNFVFAAAGYAYDEEEFKVFNSGGDGRKKQWFVYEKVEQFVN